MSLKEALLSIDFFSSLDEEKLDILSSISTLNTCSKNYIIHYEKMQNNNLLFLSDGLAKAYKIDKYNNEIFLYYIYKNSLLSEVSDIRSSTLISFSNIQTIEESTIISINYQKFKEYFLQNGILCLELSEAIIKYSQQLQSLVSREFVFDSVAKVAMMISSDLSIFNKLKRHDIALILHIQPATLSRVLKRLKRNNIIDIIQGKVLIVNKSALETIYKGLQS